MSKDKIDDSALPSTVCSFCDRLISPSKRICQAFDEKIPDEIWSGDNDHRKPVDGDSGIQFKWADEGE
jgi:hypothetical protein